MRKQQVKWFVCLGVVAASCMSVFANAARLKEIATVDGQRGNQLVGYGLVVGLDGTGDSSWSATSSGVSQSVLALLESLDVTLPPGSRITSKNVAAVMVTGELPALAKAGQKIDVTVSSLGDARSIKGGTLLLTPLRAANGGIYATAQGSVVVPSAELVGRGSRLQGNQTAAGRIPGGAYVEVAAPEAANDPTITLNFERSDYAQTQRAVEVIAGVVGADAVAPIDARSVSIRVPTDATDRINLLARLLELEVPKISAPAKVIVNSRTGSVVMNQSVTLAPFAVTHGNLSVRVTPRGRTFSGLDGSVVAPRASVSINAGPEGKIMASEGAASLDEVVRALNMLGVNPQDLMAILQGMKAAGALGAELEVI